MSRCFRCEEKNKISRILRRKSMPFGGARIEHIRKAKNQNILPIQFPVLKYILLELARHMRVLYNIIEP